MVVISCLIYQIMGEKLSETSHLILLEILVLI